MAGKIAIWLLMLIVLTDVLRVVGLIEPIDELDTAAPKVSAHWQANIERETYKKEMQIEIRAMWQMADEIERRLNARKAY